MPDIDWPHACPGATNPTQHKVFLDTPSTFSPHPVVRFPTRDTFVLDLFNISYLAHVGSANIFDQRSDQCIVHIDISLQPLKSEKIFQGRFLPTLLPIFNASIIHWLNSLTIIW